MLNRRIPGAVGTRAARTFTASSSQYLVTTGLVPLIVPPFTVAGWFNPVVASAARTLWCLGDTGTTNNYYRLTYDESVGQELDAEARDVFTIAQSTQTGATEGAWNHAAGVYASATSRTAYLNGTAGTTNTTTTNPAGLDTMSFGRLERSSPTQYMDGALSTWGIWSVALTASEIALLARGAHPTTIRPSALLECWDLDRTGPIVGLVRGTVLTPTNGGSLTPGPAIQGPPTTRRVFVRAPAAPAASTTLGGVIHRRIPGAVGVRAARSFAAASSQYLTAQPPVGMPTNVPLTLVAWFRVEDVTNSYALFGLSSIASTTDYFTLEARGSDASDPFAAVARSSSVRTQANSSGSMVAGRWHHGAGIFLNNSSRTAILDGAGGATNTTFTGAVSGVTTVTAGALRRSSGVADLLNGALAYPAVYAAALDLADIARLAGGAHPLTVRPDVLWECWDTSRPGPLVGLVRGTVLNPVNGGSLTVGPPIQGAPRLRRSVVATLGSAPTSYTLPADSGTVTATGTDARPLYQRVVAAASEAVAATGTAARLLYLRVLAALSAAIALTGTAAATLWQRVLAAASGAWTATGTAATTLWHRVLRAETATVEATGTSATLSYSGDTGPSVDEKRKTFMLMGIYK